MVKKSSRVKVISLGNVESGKSCLIKRYCEKRFVTKYMPTIGVDFGVTKVTVDDRELKVNLFDLSGNSSFKEVRNEFYKDIQAVLLVYDVTNHASFDGLESWLKELKSYCTDSNMERLLFVVCANKIDKRNSRVIQFDKGREWAMRKGFYYYETSALNGEGITEAFQILFKTLVQVIETGERPEPKKVETNSTSKQQQDVINKLKTSKDNYSRLGLSYGASKDDINKSYRKLAKLLHPDKCLAPESNDAFQILVAAKDALLKNS